MSEETHVYIISRMRKNKPAAPVKVGISANPEGRLRNLQTANHNNLVLLAAFMCPTREMAKILEGAFHEVMDECRLAGEWFDITPMRAIELMCSNFRSAFQHFLGEDPDLLHAALEASRVLSNEQKLEQWRAHAARTLNDNAAGHLQCQ